MDQTTNLERRTKPSSLILKVIQFPVVSTRLMDCCFLNMENALFLGMKRTPHKRNFFAGSFGIHFEKNNGDLSTVPPARSLNRILF